MAAEATVSCVPMTETLLEPTPPADANVAVAAPGPGWRWGVRAVVLLPIVVAALRAVVTGWFPVGDSALLAVRAADVGTADHPWLGSWTSASLALGTNVNNPGPLYHDLIAPFMWTIGRIGSYGAAVAIGVAAVNGVVALATMAAAGRIGGWRMERWVAVMVAALTWAMGSELLIDIWQPHALLLPFACLLVLTTGLLTGHWRLLPWWLAMASVIVQTHVAYVYVTGALAFTVLTAGIRQLRAHAGREGALVTSAFADAVRTGTGLGVAIVLALAWCQPMIEQFTGTGEGNLQRLARGAGGGDLTVGAGSAVKIVAAVTALPPWWGRWGWEDSVPSTALTQSPAGPRLLIEGLPNGALAALALAVLASVLAALVVLLRAPEQRPARAAAGVSLVCLAVAVGGLTIQTVTQTGLGNHQVRWIFGLAVFIHLAIAWGVAELAAELVAARGPRTRSLEPGLLTAGALLVAANLPVYAHDLGPTADRAAADTLERTFDDLVTFDPPGPVLYDTENVRVFEPYSGGVFMRLRELGVAFRFTAEIDVRQFGEHRRADGDEVGTLRQYERVDALRYDGDACTVSLRSGVSTDDEAAADALIGAAAADLTGATIDSIGLPADVAALVDGATAGDERSAYELVALAILPVLVVEDRVASTSAIDAAITQQELIVRRVNSTLRIVAEPASIC
jgi:hypothetical protein